MSNKAVQFLQYNHIDHVTSSPHFPQSNGFIVCQVRTLKTALSTTIDSKKTIDDLLLNIHSTPSGPNKPSPWEILQNRTF